MGTLHTATATVPPSAALRLEAERLLEHLRAHHVLPDAVKEISIRQFAHGQSNPTYLLTPTLSNGSLGAALVLRKKPPGKLLESAHNVAREFKVIAAVGHAGVPVPRAIYLCQDPKVLGTDFYIMSHVRGVVHKDPSLPGVPPGVRNAIYRSAIKTLASIHAVDPEGVGLGQFGRAPGYAGRQVQRWREQYLRSVPQPMHEVMRLVQWLGAHVPAASDLAPYAHPGTGGTLVHGDFRLDNVIYEETTPSRVLAVLDWELSTLGDPLSDLAYFCTVFHLPHSKILPSLTRPGMDLQGIPTEDELVDAYCEARGVPRPPEQVWRFYLGLSLFRVCGILAGVHARALQGNASSASALEFAAPSVQRAIAVAALGVVGIATGGGAWGREERGHAAIPTPTLASQEAAAGGARGALRGREHGQGAGAAGAVAGGAEGRHGVLGRAVMSAPPGVLSGSTVLGAPPSRIKPLLSRLRRFLQEHVLPVENTLADHASGPDRWTIPAAQEALKEEAKRLGLWNLWISPDLAAAMANGVPALQSDLARVERGDGGDGEAAEGRGEPWGGLLGAGLSNVEYAFCAEILGECGPASEACNCSAPDTGNMEVLGRYGSPAQKAAWLLPLLRGEVRSCFAMTEPAVASSDATNVCASIHWDPSGAAAPGEGGPGGTLTLDGVKWWISGACDPRCRVCLFMGKSDPHAAPHKQQSIVVVPMDTPGVRVVRPLTVFGFDDAPHGHAEVHFREVTVPASNVVLGLGRGFEIAQGRLGPGRLHHCMRLIGAGNRALRLGAERALGRTAFGKRLADLGSFRENLAKARVELDAARLLVLRAASAIDCLGSKEARVMVAAAKVAAPQASLRAIDVAMQVHGGAGVSGDTPLAWLWAQARTLRLADGPDEVHWGTIAQAELRSRL